MYQENKDIVYALFVVACVVVDRDTRIFKYLLMAS